MRTKGKKFISEFKKTIQNDEELKANYNPKKSNNKLSDYTEKMTKLIKRVLIEVNGVEFDESKEHIKDNYYTYNPEYYKIDYTSWNNTKIESDSDTGIKLYSWNFDFAIEHENDNKDWTYELLKLSFIRADVRIVIGYVDNQKRKNEKEIIETQVEKFRYSVSANEEYYVILMNTKLSENEDPFGMKVYSIKEKTVEKIDV